MKLDEIEAAAVIAKASKRRVTLNSQDVLLMVLYIRQAEFLRMANPMANTTVEPDLGATAKDLGLR